MLTLLPMPELGNLLHRIPRRPYSPTQWTAVVSALPDRFKTAAGAVLVSLYLVTVPGTAFGAENSAITASSQGSAESGGNESRSSSLPSLADILSAAEAHDNLHRDIRGRLTDGGRIDELAAEIEMTREAFRAGREAVGTNRLDRAGLYELIDLGTASKQYSERATAALDELAAKAKALDVDLDRLAVVQKELTSGLEAARSRNAPSNMLERHQAILQRTELLVPGVRAHRDRVLEPLSLATELRAEIDAFIANIGDHRDQAIRRMQTARGVPIWRVEPHPAELAQAQLFVSTEITRGLHYLRDQAVVLLAIAILAIVLSYWLIITSQVRIGREADTDPYARETAALFSRPGVAAFLVTLFALILLAPRGPLVYYDILSALLPIPAVILARVVLGPNMTLSLYTLAALIMSISFFGAFEALQLLSRVAVIVQCLAMGAALAIDYQRGRIEQTFPMVSATTVRWVVGGTVVLLAVAVVANGLGFLGLSRTLRTGVLWSLALGVVLAVVTRVAYGLILSLMQTRAARCLRTVRFQPDAVQRTVRIALMGLALLLWLAGTLLAFGVLPAIVHLAMAVAKSNVQIGSVTVSLKSIWIGLLVLAATYLLVKFLRAALEVEVLPRFNLRAGIPFAISTITGYLLVTAGVVLAMAAMGIDLTRVTLLAGALGVGIGFGLQGVVNNFVSGLILLLERPISIGDTVQMEDVRGEVRRIGVRSSTVRTFQGAELIVPNADLISKIVTNWTLSDRRRRLEIDVGVAYGSDPEKVLSALEAAAKDVRDVIDSPAPWAWFTGFGDSSLDFRLHAWISDYSLGLATQSALRVAIVRQLKEAGIEIPFPQRDIHIRTVPGPGVPWTASSKRES